MMSRSFSIQQNTFFGVLLILLGIAALTYQGVSHKTRESERGRVSSQESIETIKKNTIPPIVGVVGLISGIILLGRTYAKVPRNGRNV
jgi:hypothetical protein